MGTLAAWAVVIICSPLILLFGRTQIRLRDRHMFTASAYTGVIARPRRRPRSDPMSFSLRVVTNPLFIALTAPRRWVRSTLLPALALRRRRRSGGLPGGEEGLWPDAPPFLGGVREPRRPKPSPSAAGVALRVPREDVARIGVAVDEAVGRSRRSRRAGTPTDQGPSGGLAPSTS